MKQVALLVCMLAIIQMAACADLNKGKECILYNKRYTNQYVYASKDLADEKKNVADRYVFAWLLNSLGRIFSSRKSNQFFDSEPSGIWTLVPVDDSSDEKNVFYLRNVKYADEYLYASTTKYGKSNQADERRRVFARKLANAEKDDANDEGSSPNPEQFMWSFNQTEKLGEYQIYNKQFGEHLYVASLFNAHILFRRNIFTFQKKPDSEQFTFVVSCRDGLLELN